MSETNKHETEFRASLSVTFDAPLKYVYKWCTDFREDDVRIAGWSSRRHILEKSARRCVWISHYRLGDADLEAVRIVSLTPPSWHLDGLGDDLDEFGDYRLESLGKKKTRLVMRFKVVFKDPRAYVPKAKWIAGMKNDWEKFRIELERDYLKAGVGKAR
ncbi:MAG: hypothetical protein QW767_02885 [Thermoprotei archaeon]